MIQGNADWNIDSARLALGVAQGRIREAIEGDPGGLREAHDLLNLVEDWLTGLESLPMHIVVEEP